ncbi:capsid protein [Porprismacovirus porci16]|uniref:Capsid protein n=1 Tax=Porcine associated porprismacovirus TaxID=2496634 RepID=A0A482JSQ8_9VIRU|nr:capsid protein [Porcine associated porprismacovirus]QBP37078.1 capsid protein [Porcine associated porprismacovirus]
MVKASVMEIYDLQTQVGKGTVLKVHTPTGNNVKRHLLGHFLQYKQFKYLGARVTLIPASTLPADPLQLSYEAGDANIDPRDMVNPILWKHYHGETMLTDVLNTTHAKNYDLQQNVDPVSGSAVDEQFYDQLGGATSEIDVCYPRTLMDTSFKKAGIQQGFSTFVKPFVYNVVSNTQLLPRNYFYNSGSDVNKFMGAGVGNASQMTDHYPVVTSGNYLSGSDVVKYTAEDSLAHQFQANLNLTTNKLVGLGWLDTLSRDVNSFADVSQNTSTVGYNVPGIYPLSGDFAVSPNLPNIPMLYVLMPPAYKTEFYFRLIIKHFYAFRGFRSCFSVQSFGSAGIWGNAPTPADYSPASTSSIASMVESLSEDGTDTVTVENGTLLTMADGAEGES